MLFMVGGTGTEMVVAWLVIGTMIATNRPAKSAEPHRGRGVVGFCLHHLFDPSERVFIRTRGSCLGS
jgi:hypothetical protein